MAVVLSTILMSFAHQLKPECVEALTRVFKASADMLLELLPNPTFLLCT